MHLVINLAVADMLVGGFYGSRGFGFFWRALDVQCLETQLVPTWETGVTLNTALGYCFLQLH